MNKLVWQYKVLDYSSTSDVTLGSQVVTHVMVQYITQRTKVQLTVFPDPVCAQAMTSLPAMMVGIAYFWTGVGLLYLAFFTFKRHCSVNWAWSNDWIGLTGSLPVTSTGMSSNLAKLMPCWIERKMSSSLSEGVGGT